MPKQEERDFRSLEVLENTRKKLEEHLSDIRNSDPYPMKQYRIEQDEAELADLNEKIAQKQRERLQRT